ncbi:hypothetical protein MUN81_10495 [Hymenobacter sp. 5317J-9]|uniref:hypothetical protein n=1 Tax=Hymenobacter sp. 5317J-9 TaxID=2932250 RepID=UPI001FD6E8FA|nr:hypothetical protein [Hymenobacter sp. 5317J-9]UOQ99908.1 hypothetical protein MUN81_10495 [Hymenobacter sp. 5317J-9]
MAKTKKSAPPIGFGRNPAADDLDDDSGAKAPAPEKVLEPPLAEPIFVDTLVMYETLSRYNIHPLVPLGTTEFQLVQVIAGLEKRIRELDHDLY